MGEPQKSYVDQKKPDPKDVLYILFIWYSNTNKINLRLSKSEEWSLPGRVEDMDWKESMRALSRIWKTFYILIWVVIT